VCVSFCYYATTVYYNFVQLEKYFKKKKITKTKKHAEKSTKKIRNLERKARK